MKRCVPYDKCILMYSATKVVIMTSIQTLCNYFPFMRLMSGAVGGIDGKGVPIQGQRPFSLAHSGVCICLFIDLSIFNSG